MISRWYILTGRDIPLDLIAAFWKIVPHQHMWYRGPNASRDCCARCTRWKD